MAFDAQAVSDEVAAGIEQIGKADDMDGLKAIKSRYAGADSMMTAMSKAIGALPADRKKDAGQLMGKLRADFGRAFGQKASAIKERDEARALAAESVDMTMPVRRRPLGARHPIAKVMEDVEDLFVSMGWQVSRGPEVETSAHTRIGGSSGDSARSLPKMSSSVYPRRRPSSTYGSSRAHVMRAGLLGRRSLVSALRCAGPARSTGPSTAPS